MNKIKKSSIIIITLAVLFCIPALTNATNTRKAESNEINVKKARIIKDMEENKNQPINEETNVNKRVTENSNRDKAETRSIKDLNGIDHKSEVSVYIQNLRATADKISGGIGEQVREVANAQNESKEKVGDIIDKIQNRNRVRVFFVGTDYKNIGELKSEITKTDNQISKLNQLSEKATSTDSKLSLKTQVQDLENVRQKINDFVNVNESRFSLFGWFAKAFKK